jgi:hypothetical protein
MQTATSKRKTCAAAAWTTTRDKAWARPVRSTICHGQTRLHSCCGMREVGLSTGKQCATQDTARVLALTDCYSERLEWRRAVAVMRKQVQDWIRVSRDDDEDCYGGPQAVTVPDAGDGSA